jgi:hypothetical protein
MLFMVQQKDKKALRFTIDAQAVVSTFLLNVSPFFTGNIKKLFSLYLKHHKNKSLSSIPHWQHAIIDNVFNKMLANNQRMLKKSQTGYQYLFHAQKEWIVAHNLLLNAYLIRGGRSLTLDQFLDSYKEVIGQYDALYREFFLDGLPSFLDCFEALSPASLNQRMVLLRIRLANPIVFSQHQKNQISLQPGVILFNTDQEDRNVNALPALQDLPFPAVKAKISLRPLAKAF